MYFKGQFLFVGAGLHHKLLTPKYRIMLKKLLFLISICLIAGLYSLNLQAQCADLFFSEYVEGNYNNKALEIYNPTNQTVDLSGYRIIRWSNGNNIYDPVAAVTLSGTVAAKDVVVVVIDKQDCSIGGADTCVFQELKDKADLYVCPVYAESNALYHNGNDAISLNRTDGATTQFGSTGSFVDIFGIIGEDPGQSWTDVFPYTESAGGAFWTKDQTLTRKFSVQTGVTTNPGSPYSGAWNPTAQWDSLPRNTFNHLGWHQCQCGDAPNSIPTIVSGKVSLYPNPATEQFVLSNSETKIEKIEIYNLLGELQTQQTVNQYQTQITVQGWAKGTYFVKTLFTNNTISYDKLLVQ